MAVPPTPALFQLNGSLKKLLTTRVIYSRNFKAFSFCIEFITGDANRKFSFFKKKCIPSSYL